MPQVRRAKRRARLSLTLYERASFKLIIKMGREDRVSNLSTGEWIAIISIVVALVIGMIQIFRKSNSKTGSININQSSGALSKGNQKMDLKVNQNDK